VTVALLPIFMEERRRYYIYDISVSSDLSMLLTMARIEPGLFVLG